MIEHFRVAGNSCKILGHPKNIITVTRNHNSHNFVSTVLLLLLQDSFEKAVLL